MKKFTILTIVLVIFLSVTACGLNGKNEIKLGTSDFSVMLPEGYEKTDDDFDENQIAYYYKDDDSIDFDVYQWAKEGGNTLESESERFANEYGTEPETVVINGITTFKYISEEEYDGVMYTIVSYLFEDEDSFMGLCFWTSDTDEKYTDIDEIINTLKKN